jgi:hypothetical protein
MYKRLAFGLTIVLIGTGLVFLGLDIFDIAEGYKSSVRIAFVDTIFISLFAVPVIYLTFRGYMANHAPEMLWLNFAVFTFGLSILIYGWFTETGLNAHLVSYDSGILLASIFHVIGMRYGKSGVQKNSPNLKSWAIIIIYLGIAGVIGLITWLASSDVIVVTGTAGGIIETRVIPHGIAVILMLIVAVVFLSKYLKTHLDFYYWYVLGLVLLSCGVFFITIGQLEGRVAWTGRVCQYVSSVYFLVAAFYSRKISG